MLYHALIVERRIGAGIVHDAEFLQFQGERKPFHLSFFVNVVDFSDTSTKPDCASLSKEMGCKCTRQNDHER